MSRWPRDWPTYGCKTDEGDIAIQRVVRLVEAEVRMGQVAQGNAMADRIRLGLKYVAYQATDGNGHPEVYDERVQQAIEDEVNRLCLKNGWCRVSRWEW